MHVFLVAFYISGVLYAILEEQELILYFLFTIGVYVALSAFLPGSKPVGNRKKIMISTWGDPSEGCIHVRVAVRAQKVLEIIQKYHDTKRLTLTHFAIRACGELLGQSKDICGKLAFGKFVPFESADISCLVDIDGGKDLAMINVKQVNKKSVTQIADYIREKGSKIKSGKGDAQHKKRTKSADFLPAFVVGALLQLASFLVNKLGISIPAIGVKRHQFGAACVTSLGMLNFEDAFAPFSPFMDCVFLLAVNAVHDEAVAQNGQVKVGKVLNCNFTVDHRYVDGGKAKTFISAFKRVFEDPEKYVDGQGQQLQQKDNKDSNKTQ